MSTSLTATVFLVVLFGIGVYYQWKTYSCFKSALHKQISYNKRHKLLNQWKKSR